LTNQEYTITQNAINYQVPVYTADPLWCEILYRYEITEISGDQAIQSFDNDPASRTFTFFNDNDLTLSTLTQKAYTVTVFGKSGNITPTESGTTFTLTLKNPCIDPAFVTINAGTV